ncbi:ABC-type sugar transport system ATPase subunit [Arthrobacter oryzae]|nr:ABC-type sugar transport system ATPase subunit [Arthrobacter oryzae]
MRRQASELFQRLGVPIDPSRVAEGLSIADQQIIEIAKAISMEAKVLVMDEPTAALSGVEVDRLFAVARALRDKGTGILFISRRFAEVFDLCDRSTVMRDGRYIATHRTADVTVERIVREMVGRDIGTLFPKTEADIGNTVLNVDGIRLAQLFALPSSRRPPYWLLRDRRPRSRPGRDGSQGSQRPLAGGDEPVLRGAQRRPGRRLPPADRGLPSWRPVGFGR